MHNGQDARGLWSRTKTLLSRKGFAAAAISTLAVTAIVGGVACGGGGKKTPTATPDTAASAATKPAVTMPTPGVSAGLVTPIAISEGSQLLPSDLAARGKGDPGRGEFTGTRIVIPSIQVDAPFSNKVVGTDGQMPNPNGPEDVAYYDFSQWPGLGGLPGKGGNVVVAGHVDYINYGPAVFWRLSELQLGDTVELQMADGSTATYKIEFNKQIEVGDADWTGIVEATADESITLITCAGQFESGRYTNRQIVWGRKVA